MSQEPPSPEPHSAEPHSAEQPSPQPSPPEEPAPAPEAGSKPPNAFVELLVDFLRFLREEKKWWLIPILLALAVIVGLAVLLNLPDAPFVYPLF